MASSPPGSPLGDRPRPVSQMMRAAPRTNSRMSMTSKGGGGSRASDEDGKTSVKVGTLYHIVLQETETYLFAMQLFACGLHSNHQIPDLNLFPSVSKDRWSKSPPRRAWLSIRHKARNSLCSTKYLARMSTRRGFGNISSKVSARLCKDTTSLCWHMVNPVLESHILWEPLDH
jgi:hypothetical protein